MPGSGDSSSDEEAETASTSTSRETVPLLTPDGQRIGTLVKEKSISNFFLQYLCRLH